MKLLHVGGEPWHNFAQLKLFSIAWPGEVSWRMFDSLKSSPLAGEFPPGSFVDERYCGSPEMQRDLKRHSVVIVHGMDGLGQAILDSDVNESVRVVWSAYGYEYSWAMERALGPLLLPRTQRWKEQQDRENRKGLIRRRLRKLGSPSKASEFLRRRLRSPRSFEQLCLDYQGRFDIVAMDSGSLRLARMYLPQLTDVTWETQYVILDDFSSYSESRGNLLVGNSARLFNNHLDKVDDLMGINFSSVAIPLSYGNARYGEVVAEEYSCKLGANLVKPIFDYIDRVQWQRFVRNSTSVLLNQRRQQAFGTALIALSGGCRVYLRAENPISSSLKEKGAYVCDIESSEDLASAVEPLDRNQALRNIEVGAEFASIDAGKRKVEKLFALVSA